MPTGEEKKSDSGAWKIRASAFEDWSRESGLVSKQGMGRRQFPTLGTFLSALSWTEVDGGHEADQLHGLCLH